MPQETCILTARDLSILEAMLERCHGREDPMAVLLRRKIESARIVFGEDVAPDVATLDSRVVYRVGAREPDTRVISRDATRTPVGLFLPVSSPRGLALIGLSEGEEFVLTGADGTPETIRLEKVLYQPEAARREKLARAAEASPEARRRGLRIIDGAYADRPRSVHTGTGGFDDPGPSAA